MGKQVDQKIVEMRFENSTFEKNVSQTMKTLDKLKEKLGFKNAGEGFSNIQKSADKISFEHLIQSVDKLEYSISNKSGLIEGVFEALGGKIVEIFDNTFGKVQQMINQVTFQPIETGFSEYELKIGSVQTIAANTGVLMRDLMGDMMESGEAITATADDLETAWAVMEGIYGNGAERVELLGDRYSVVQDLVNQIVRGEIKMGESIDFATDAAQKQEYTMADIEYVLDDLNTYADKTIYNYGQMTNAIGRFTVAGIDLYDAQSNVIGLSNLAAFVGADAEDTARIMRELAQAMNTGYVSLADWRSLINSSGFSGTVFQDNIESIANHMYASNDAYRAQIQAIHPWLAEVENQNEAISTLIEYYGSFKDSLTQGKWFTSDVLTNTLHIFAGNWSDEMYAALGYTEQEIANLQSLGEVAFDAATKSKTFTQMWASVTEAAQSSWTTTWEYIFGHFYDARNLWTIVGDALSDIIDSNNRARNEVLQIWSETGGREEFFSGVGHIFTFFKNIADSLKDIWTTLFPPITGEMLTDFSIKFNQFAEALEHATIITDFINASFSLFSKLLKIILVAFSVFAVEFKNVFGIGIFDRMKYYIKNATIFIENLTNSLINVDSASGVFKSFFDYVFDIIKELPTLFIVAIAMVNELSEEFLGFSISSVIKDFIANITSMSAIVSDKFSEIKNNLIDIKTEFVNTIHALYDKIKMGNKIVQPVIDYVNDIINKIKDGSVIGFVLDKISNFFSKLKNIPIVKGALESISQFADKLVSPESSKQIVNIAAGLVQLLIALSGLKAIRSLNKASDILPDISSFISDTFDNITDTVESFENLAKSGIIITIAQSILMLAISMGIMALIPTEKLKEVTATILIVMGGLMLLMKVLTGLFSVWPANNTLLTGASALTLLAISIGMLVGSIVILTLLDYESAVKSLVIIGVIMALVGALIEKFNHARFRSNIPSVSFAIIMLSQAIANITILIAALSFVAKYNSDGLWESFGMISLMLLYMGVLYTVLAKVSITSTPKQFIAISLGINAIIAVVYSIVALMSIMVLLSHYYSGETLFASFSAVIFMISMVVLAAYSLASIPVVSPAGTLAVAAAMLIIVSSIFGIITALLYVQKIQNDEIWKPLLTLTGIITLTMMLIAILGTITPGRAASILAAAVAMDLLSWVILKIASGLLVLSKVDFNETKVIAVVGGTIAAISVLMGLMMVFSTFSTAHPTLTRNFNFMFGGTSPIAKFLIGLSALILSISVSLWLVVDAVNKLMDVADKFNKDNDIVNKMINMFKGIAKAFSESWSYIAEAIDNSGIGDDLERWFDSFLLHLVHALANLLSALVAIASVLAESIVDIIIAVLNGLTGTDLTTWYEAIEGNGVTEEIFESFIKSAEGAPLNKLINAAVAFITLLVYGIGQALLNMVKPIGGLLLEFFAALWRDAIYPDLVSLGGTLYNGLAIWYNDVSSFMWTILLGIAYTIAKEVEWLINTVIIDPLNAIFSSISSLLGFGDFKIFERVDFTSGISNLMEVVIGQSNEAAAAVDNASNSLQNFTDKLDNLSNKNITSTVTLSPVLNTDQSRLNSALYYAGDTAGEESLKGFNHAWDIHSPSKKGEESGTNIGAGVVNGITGYFNTPEAQEKLTAIKDSLPKIDWNSMYDAGDSEYETNPTKVFNFNTEGMGDSLLQGDFGTKFKGLTDNMGGVSTDLAEVNDYTQKISDALANEGGKFYDDTDVINELTGLRGDISDLSQAIANIKLYLDSNKLVGELVGPMDSALAQRATRSRRGN